MRLPEELLTAIQREVDELDQTSLARASTQLTQRYKAGTFSGPAITEPAQRAAYLIARMPATYAANWSVFSEIHRLAPSVAVESLLDLGGGPGTALFAGAETFPELRQATVVESDESWLNLGRRWASQSSRTAVQAARWINHDLRQALDCQPHDLVVISYALGELQRDAVETLLRRAWECSGKILVIIEPGTPRGFATVHAARTALIANQAQLLAPCPHHDACPMAGTRDWCHFAQRVERTSRHRQV